MSQDVRRFEFVWDDRLAAAARLFGVTPRTAYVDVGDERVEARFGPWFVQTSRSNVVAATKTGPYQPWKVAGPAHLSLADLGLTFSTTAKGGVCLKFREPVRGIDPLGVVRHPGLTVTVDDVDGLVAMFAPVGADGSGARGSDGPPATTSPRQRLTQGAVAGIAGAVLMLPVMSGLRLAFGDHRSVAPKVVTQRGLGADRLPKPLGAAATLPTHLAFGAGNGAAFALVGERIPGPRPVKAVLFALGVMLLSYEGWVPLFGILPPLRHQRRGRAAAIVCSHLVYGAALAKLVNPGVAAQ